MVNLATIRQSNARFAADEHHKGLVCVFAGATSGIGAGTLESMARMLRKKSPTFYVVGRSAARFDSQQRAKLEELNPSSRLVFLEAELTLLEHVDAVCEKIVAAEQKVDYLYMSQGLMPLNAPQYTKEGLETCFALSYYCRMRLVQNLLPLLRKSPNHPRVLCVLNAGCEKAMLDDDLGLELNNHHNCSTVNIINHTTTMTSLALEHLALARNGDNDNERITFMHAYPGWVETPIFAKLTAPESSGIPWRMTLATIRGLVAVIMHLFAISSEESGERQAFQLTGGGETFGPGGGGFWLVGHESDVIDAPAVLERYREGGWRERVWEFSMGVFERVLSGSGGGDR